MSDRFCVITYCHCLVLDSYLSELAAALSFYVIVIHACEVLMCQQGSSVLDLISPGDMSHLPVFSHDLMFQYNSFFYCHMTIYVSSSFVVT